MLYCTVCGSLLSPEDLFCSNCGSQPKAIASQASAPILQERSPQILIPNYLMPDERVLYQSRNPELRLFEYHGIFAGKDRFMVRDRVEWVLITDKRLTFLNDNVPIFLNRSALRICYQIIFDLGLARELMKGIRKRKADFLEINR